MKALSVRPTPSTIIAQTWFPGLVSLLVLGFALSNVLGSATADWFDYAVLILATSSLVAMGFRAGITRLEIADEGVMVRNFWRTIRLEWSEVILIGWDAYSVGPRAELMAPCVAFSLSRVSTERIRLTLGRLRAKVTVGQPSRVKVQLVETLRDLAGEHGIPFKLDVTDLRFKLFETRTPPQPDSWE